MITIINDRTDPYYNLACEEYIFNKYQDEDVFMLWRDEPSIIVGKNQNTLAEVNIDYVREHKIPVVRRLSGGGAVFHDLGNLNFTFITSDEGGAFNDFQRYTKPIVNVLGQLGVEASFSGRNDLVIDGKKFSGNAQYKKKKRVLHHGTLLFAAEIEDLSAALKPRESKFEGKGIKSVISRVTNIAHHLPEPMTVETFKDHLQKEVGADAEVHVLTPDEIQAIEKLAEEKYRTWEWNFGSSPDYSFQREKKFPGGHVEVCFNVKEGQISDAVIYGDFFSERDLDDVYEVLNGSPHDHGAIRERLESLDFARYFYNITLEELLSCID